MITENKIDSKFFEFSSLNIKKGLDISFFKGWNKSIIIKFNLKKDNLINNLFIKKYFPYISNKEKLFVFTSGRVELKKNSKKVFLEKFDALNSFSDEINYEIRCLENSEFYLISCEKFKKINEDSVYFNFEKNIKSKDIWGGQCISRPFVGREINLVLFDLKPGFEFEDKGHFNEQITWLIEGSMDFYSQEIKKKLTYRTGVDIGPNHFHGGVSNGAVGFDAFFPKRGELNYIQNIKTVKF